MLNETNSVAAGFLILVTTYLAHSTLLLGGTWLLLRFGRVRSWILRDRLWKLAAVLPLFTAPITFPASISAPVIQLTLNGLFSLSHPTESNTTVAVNSTALTTVALSDVPVIGTEQQSLTILAPERFVDGHLVEPALSAGELAMAPSPVSVGPLEPPSGRTPGSSALLGVCCSILALAGGGLARIFWQSIVFRRTLRKCRTINRGTIVDMLDIVLRRARMRRPIRLLSSKQFTQPAAFGIFRWTILLPEELIHALQPDELEALLAHEAAHLARGDAIWLWAGRILCSCCAFQPLNFVALQGWRRSAEFLCDQWSVRHSANRFALARCLTRVAMWRVESPPRSAVLLAVGGRSSLSERVEWLVGSAQWTDSWDTRRRRRLVSVAALVVAVGFICAAPRAHLIAETHPESNRSLSAAESDPDATLAESIRQLGQEVRQLTVELQAIDTLVTQHALRDPAIRALATRLAVRSAVLLERQQRLANLTQNPSTQKKGF